MRLAAALMALAFVGCTSTKVVVVTTTVVTKKKSPESKDDYYYEGPMEMKDVKKIIDEVLTPDSTEKATD